MGNMDRFGSKGHPQPDEIPANVFPVDCKDVVDDDSFFEHDYHKSEEIVRRDIAHVLAGETPEVPWRIYIPETNSYRLTDPEGDQHPHPPILLY